MESCLLIGNNVTCFSTSPGLNPSARRGWVASPSSRGTMDIIWNCVSTLFICLYSMLHLNVPAPTDKYWTIFWRKLRWVLLGILAPELPMLIACGQFASAQRSVEAMRALGYTEEQWTLSHAFYADAGGFVLQSPDVVAFPITAKQVRYLVTHGYLELPTITAAEVCDKSKANNFAKYLAYLQTSWLTIQTIGRAVQHLPITPIELSTIAMSFCSLTTLFFWFHKPLDVEAPSYLTITHSVADILREAGDAAKEPYTDTPLDFIEPRVYMSGKWSEHFLRWISSWGLQTRPLRRIPNDRDPQPSGLRQHVMLGIATATFASIHLLGWNFSFDTDWEQKLWRANCVAMWCLLAVYGTTEVMICVREGYQNLGLETLNAYKMKWPACLAFFIPACLYFCARLIVLFEVVFSMRSLPAGAFVQVRWASFVPHL